MTALNQKILNKVGRLHGKISIRDIAKLLGKDPRQISRYIAYLKKNRVRVIPS